MLAREMITDEIITIEADKHEAWLYAEAARKDGKSDKMWIDKLTDELKEHGIKLPDYPQDDEDEFWTSE